MWPIQLAFRFLISCRIFLCSLTLSNTSSFFTWSVQLIFSILLQHHISNLSRYLKFTTIHFYSLCFIIAKLHSQLCPNCVPDPLMPWCMPHGDSKAWATKITSALAMCKYPTMLLYAFFWVIPRRLNFICQRFGTPCLFHLHRRIGMKND